MAEERRVTVVGMDGSAEADQALDFYMKNIHRENDDLVVLHCVHHRAVYTYESVWMPTDPGAISQAYHEENTKGTQLCKAIEAKLKNYKVSGRVIKLEGGEPGHTVCHKAEELGATLIVIGCRGMGKIRRTIFGSVSDFILHHAKCPVIVCRH